MIHSRNTRAVIPTLTVGLLAAAVTHAAGPYSIVQLGVLPGSGRNSSMVRAINAAGDVVGRSGTPANTATEAFIRSGGALQGIGVLPGGEYSEASGLNDLGEVVGSSNTASRIRAFRWTRGAGMQD